MDNEPMKTNQELLSRIEALQNENRQLLRENNELQVPRPQEIQIPKLIDQTSRIKALEEEVILLQKKNQEQQLQINQMKADIIQKDQYIRFLEIKYDAEFEEAKFNKAAYEACLHDKGILYSNQAIQVQTETKKRQRENSLEILFKIINHAQKLLYFEFIIRPTANLEFSTTEVQAFNLAPKNDKIITLVVNLKQLPYLLPSVVLLFEQHCVPLIIPCTINKFFTQGVVDCSSLQQQQSVELRKLQIPEIFHFQGQIYKIKWDDGHLQVFGPENSVAKAIADNLVRHFAYQH